MITRNNSVMSKYKILSKNNYKYNNYILTTIREKDIEKIRIWRNKQINILRQSKIITKQEQIDYYNQNIKKLFIKKNPESILFSIIQNQKCIGYGGFVHIDWNNMRAEISFLIEPKRMNQGLYKKDFSEFLNIILKIGFDEIKFNKLTTETFNIRPETIKILENKNFKKEGMFIEHVKIKDKFVNSILHGILKKDIYEKNNCQLNILITSISKKIPLINSVKKSGSRINNNVKIFGGDSDNTCIGKYFIDEFWHMPKLEKLSIIKLIDYCKKKKISVIIPTRDGELLFYAKNKSTLNKNKISVMISSEKTVSMCLNKLRFYKKLNAYGFPVIKTTSKISDLNCKKIVVKENYGSGSQNIGLNLDRNSAIIYSKKLENPIFQPYVKGEEFSVDLYINKNGKLMGSVIRKRNLVTNGESQISEVIENKKIEKICFKITEKIKFYGHIIFQIIIDEKNRVKIIECNCRFGGASTLSLVSGLDSFYWFLLESQKHNLEKHSFIKIKYKKQIRYPKDLII